MTDERILEIARRYDSNCNMYSASYVFSKEDLNAFAQSVIEADRESSDAPVAWYDKHGMITHDPFEGVTPLYTRPAPARKPLSEDEIRSIMLANGFTIKDGCEDLKPYVYAAVRAIEQKIWGNSE